MDIYVCRNCSKNRASAHQQRGLCRKCYNDLSIRMAYDKIIHFQMKPLKRINRGRQPRCWNEQCSRPIKPLFGRCVCNPCYQKAKDGGELLVFPLISMLERFLAQIDFIGDCWIWQGSVAKNGYGRIFDQNLGKYVRVHRYSFELWNGWINENKLVCHDCDNPLCVNPSHFWLGTSIENNADRDRKGRGRYGRNAPGRSVLVV